MSGVHSGTHLLQDGGYLQHALPVLTEVQRGVRGAQWDSSAAGRRISPARSPGTDGGTAGVMGAQWDSSAAGRRISPARSPGTDGGTAGCQGRTVGLICCRTADISSTLSRY